MADLAQQVGQAVVTAALRGVGAGVGLVLQFGVVGDVGHVLVLVARCFSIQDMGRQTPMPPIYGRDAEMATLAGAWDRAASGRLAVVLIEGEAGIGKSRLLEEALAAARGRGMQVTASRAEELQRTRPG